MASTEPSHQRTASKSSASALEAARARIRKDEQHQSHSSYEPETPTRRNRSLISSLGSSSSALSFRNEEDAVILEFGSRWLRAGFEGDSAPMCAVGFGPAQSRRVGDFRDWIRRPQDSSSSNGGPAAKTRPVDPEQWARNHELWRMDLRDVDLGLVEDKIERAVREIYNKYLLTDAGNARLVLVLPSVMPHPLLSTLLTTLFNRWRFPSITLLPSAAMAATAAGLRAALVVDIGWAESVVSGIYEYREIETRRTTRAMKLVMQEMGRLLSKRASESETTEESEDGISVDFDYCEEVVTKLAWCKSSEKDEKLTNNVTLPSPSSPGTEWTEIPFTELAKPVERALFATGVEEHELDDHEKPLHQVVYDTLLALPTDVRAACMARIVFTGGGSKIPGLRQRIMQDVESLVSRYGWCAMRGRVIEDQIRKKGQTPNPELQTQQRPAAEQPPSRAETPGSSANEEGEEVDFVEQKLRRNRAKDAKPYIQGQFRQIETLGPWAGASLVTSLKVRGLVEIERDRFLQHGLASASRDLELSIRHVADRRSAYGGVGNRSSVGGDRSSWTLAGWG